MALDPRLRIPKIDVDKLTAEVTKLQSMVEEIRQSSGGEGSPKQSGDLEKSRKSPSLFERVRRKWLK